MKIEKHLADQMTPVERIKAIENGQDYDRVLCVPFIGNMRCLLLGVNEEEYINSAKHMVDGEIAAYNRFGFDRLGIGPNTRGISDALCEQFTDYEKGKIVEDIYDRIAVMEPVNAKNNKEILGFLAPYLGENGIVCTTQNGLPEESVSLVLGGGHSIGVPLATAAKRRKHATQFCDRILECSTS